MKIKRKKILLLLLLFLLNSCNKVIREYYESGEIKSEVFNINADSIQSHFKYYYKNGNIMQEGNLDYDGNYIDTLSEFYSDGSLKWKGKTENGSIPIFQNGEISGLVNKNYHLKSEYPYIQVGKPFSFRIYIDGLYPGYYIVTQGFWDKIEVTLEAIDTLDYPYVITLTEDYMNWKKEKICSCFLDSTLQIFVHFPDEKGTVSIKEDGNPIFFNIPIKE